MIYSYPELKGVIKVGDKVRAVKGKTNSCQFLQSDSEGEVISIRNDEFELRFSFPAPKESATGWGNTYACVHSFRDEVNFLEIIEPEEPYKPMVGDVIQLEAVVDLVGQDGSDNTYFSFKGERPGSCLHAASKECMIHVTLLSRPTPPRKVTRAELEKLVGGEFEIVD